MTTTGQPTPPPAAIARRLRRRRGPLFVVVVLLAVAVVGVLDWNAYRATHIAMHGVGDYGGLTACMGAGDAAATHGLAVGIGIYGVDRPARVTFTGVTAVSRTPNMVIDRAFLVPGVLLGTLDEASLTGFESVYQLENTVNPGQQIFSIPKAEQDRQSGDRWNLIVVVRTTDPSRPASIHGFRVHFDAPWHVGLTDTTDIGVEVGGTCGSS